LFQFFDRLQPRHRQRGDLHQELARISIDAQVLARPGNISAGGLAAADPARPRRAVIGNRGLGKIERPPLPVRDNFSHVGVEHLLQISNGRHQGDHRRCALAAKRLDQAADVRARKERLIALNVDDHVAIELGRNFRHPVCARRVAGRRHHRAAAKPFHCAGDAFIVSGDENFPHRRLFSPPHHPFDHRPAVNVRQGFPGQPGRGIAGRNHHRHPRLNRHAGERTLEPGSAKVF
jgi:hypothetical protein